MATLVKVVIQSGGLIVGAEARRIAIASRPRRVTAARIDRCRGPRGADAPGSAHWAGPGSPRDRDDAAPRQVEQSRDREHERCGRAVRGDVRVRGEDRLREADREPAEHRHPERPQPADQRRRERRDDEERQGRVVERGEQVGEHEARRTAGEPRAEPGSGLDATHRDAEHGGDLAIVRERTHRGAELRHAQEDADGGREHDRETQRDDLRQADGRFQDHEPVVRRR